MALTYMAGIFKLLLHWNEESQIVLEQEMHETLLPGCLEAVI